MDLEPHWLIPPTPDPARSAEFDAILDRALAAGPEHPLEYDSDAPRWQFLMHVAKSGRYVLHGSNNPSITVFEPRQSDDVHEFGNRTAIYAASDGLWPMYFAIVDRSRHVSLVNASITDVADPTQTRYFFSISAERLAEGAFRDGTVYILPNEEFELDHEYEISGHRVRANQVARRTEVAPLAKLSVSPTDFPFLDQIRGHDQETVMRRVEADIDGFPWLTDKADAPGEHA